MACVNCGKMSCPGCQAEDPAYKAARTQRIAENQGPVFGSHGTLRIMQVEPGTVVRDEASGREVTVTGDRAAVQNGCLVVTRCVWDRIKSGTTEAYSMSFHHD